MTATSRYLSWLNRDGKMILATVGLRSFAYGFVSVILAIYLEISGLDAFQIGLVITLILVCGACTTLLSSIYADRIGRRRFLFVTSLLMAVTGIIYAASSNIYLLLLGALTGTLSPSGSEVSAFLSLEQAMLPQSSPPEKRNSAYVIYNTVGQLTGAGGALFSAMPVIFGSFFHLGQIDSYRPMFAIYSLTAFAMAGLYLAISQKMELATPAKTTSRQMLTPQSRRVIGKFSAILAADAFSGGFVMQTIIAYWFHTKFSTPLELLSTIFFITGVLSSFSLILAGKLADRIGAVKTMVFTHLPANLLLFGIPLAPEFGLALSFYVARSMITLMDIPARQAYTVSIVKPHERTAAAGITNISRNAARAVSPSIAGYALQFVSLTIPFFVAGAVYTASDLVLYTSFRRIKPLDDTG